MTFGLVFWILMLLWLIYGFWGYWAPGNPNWQWGNALLLFILFLLLGWKVFGAPVHAATANSLVNPSGIHLAADCSGWRPTG